MQTSQSPSIAPLTESSDAAENDTETNGDLTTEQSSSTCPTTYTAQLSLSKEKPWCTNEWQTLESEFTGKNIQCVTLASVSSCAETKLRSEMGCPESAFKSLSLNARFAPIIILIPKWSEVDIALKAYDTTLEIVVASPSDGIKKVEKGFNERSATLTPVLMGNMGDFMADPASGFMNLMPMVTQLSGGVTLDPAKPAETAALFKQLKDMAVPFFVYISQPDKATYLPASVKATIVEFVDVVDPVLSLGPYLEVIKKVSEC